MDPNPSQKPKSDQMRRITGLIGTLIFAIFIIGLSHSISTGFAGFNGGLPFAIIAGLCILMAIYDYWDSCFRKRD